MKITLIIPKDRMDIEKLSKEVNNHCDFVSPYPREHKLSSSEAENLVISLNREFSESFEFFLDNGYLIAKSKILGDVIKNYAEPSKEYKEIKSDSFYASYSFNRGMTFEHLDYSDEKLIKSVSSDNFARNIAILISACGKIESGDFTLEFKESDFTEAISKCFHLYESNRNCNGDLSGLMVSAVIKYIYTHVG